MLIQSYFLLLKIFNSQMYAGLKFYSDVQIEILIYDTKFTLVLMIEKSLFYLI